MDDDIPEELVTIETFLNDFENELRSIDDVIFTSIGHPPGTILVFSEFPTGGIPDTRVSSIASFLLMTPKTEPQPSNVALLPVKHECYVLWQGGIERKIRSLSRDLNYSGIGDRGIKEFWFLSAIALVRCRVLFRADWYQRARIRTVASMTKHAGIFGDNAFMKLRDLSRRSDDKKRTPLEIDMQLTQLLVSAALENDYSLSSALELLTTD